MTHDHTLGYRRIHSERNGCVLTVFAEKLGSDPLVSMGGTGCRGSIGGRIGSGSASGSGTSPAYLAGLVGEFFAQHDSVTCEHNPRIYEIAPALGAVLRRIPEEVVAIIPAQLLAPSSPEVPSSQGTILPIQR